MQRKEKNVDSGTSAPPFARTSATTAARAQRFAPALQLLRIRSSIVGPGARLDEEGRSQWKVRSQGA